MRIDPFNSAAVQLSSDLASQKVSSQKVGTQTDAASAATSQNISDGDRTTLTSDTASLSSLVSTALSSPEVRQGKVNDLRQAINNGEYQVDPSSVAAAMVGESS